MREGANHEKGHMREPPHLHTKIRARAEQNRNHKTAKTVIVRQTIGFSVECCSESAGAQTGAPRPSPLVAPAHNFEVRKGGESSSREVAWVLKPEI